MLILNAVGLQIRPSGIVFYHSKIHDYETNSCNDYMLYHGNFSIYFLFFRKLL